jgi:hypothetical protein
MDEGTVGIPEIIPDRFPSSMIQTAIDVEHTEAESESFGK